MAGIMTRGSQALLADAWGAGAWRCVVPAFPRLSQAAPGIRGLPRLACTCAGPGSFTSPLELVIIFVNPLRARLSEARTALREPTL
ncbi:hypothetical protein NDU88_004383 [Pleurodeles waltl]|uniref:Uncharacterized protein n=1 Tax=Pleurodeles waltl TaxID=8319 RepID=A0AAV7NN98_PLEWA|nr:hypothetical protein NDU88_004383 [Pleurodeles waltl]